MTNNWVSAFLTIERDPCKYTLGASRAQCIPYPTDGRLQQHIYCLAEWTNSNLNLATKFDTGVAC